jgi:hypothetical protein
MTLTSKHMHADSIAKSNPAPQLVQKTRNYCNILWEDGLFRIVAEVERCLSVVEDLVTGVPANLQRATRLRQSILQNAFTENFSHLNR